MLLDLEPRKDQRIEGSDNRTFLVLIAIVLILPGSHCGKKNPCDTLQGQGMDSDRVFIAKRSPTDAGCNTLGHLDDCPHIILRPDGKAQVFLRLYPAPMIEHQGTYSILDQDRLQVVFRYSNPEYNGCFGNCFHTLSDLSNTAYTSCGHECKKKFMERYGKMQAIFPVKVTLRRRDSDIFTSSIQGRDPDPIPGKQVLQFSEDFEDPVKCLVADPTETADR